MGGVGSFNRQNRTLYVGRIKETGTGLETEEVVRRHFKEWGEIERGMSSIYSSRPPHSSCILQMTLRRVGLSRCCNTVASRL
jgi:hypothetical protein